MDSTKTVNGIGGSLNVSVASTTNKPNGSPGDAPSGCSVPSAPKAGSVSGIKTSKLDSDKAPNKISKSGGNHGGTVSASPTPTGQGVPGVPMKQRTIPNK